MKPGALVKPERKFLTTGGLQEDDIGIVVKRRLNVSHRFAYDVQWLRIGRLIDGYLYEDLIEVEPC